MENRFTKEWLHGLVSDCIEENGQLEYKEIPTQREEITKDISAFANATGGILIYGICEFREKTKKHLPEKVKPFDQSAFSKEKLDQIIGLIQPRINGIAITPIHIGPNIQDYCYVVAVPQGTTAHQALDKKYYRRRNFEVTPMEDYEIRETMNRKIHPELVVKIKIIKNLLNPHVAFEITNNSEVIAKDFCITARFPLEICPENSSIKTINGMQSYEISIFNENHIPLFPKQTLLKGFSYQNGSVLLDQNNKRVNVSGISEIQIEIYADEMPRIVGTMNLSDAKKNWAEINSIEKFRSDHT